MLPFYTQSMQKAHGPDEACTALSDGIHHTKRMMCTSSLDRLVTERRIELPRCASDSGIALVARVVTSWYKFVR